MDKLNDKNLKNYMDNLVPINHDWIFIYIYQ